MPFLFTAGKGMDERVCELRVRYKPHSLNAMLDPASAEFADALEDYNAKMALAEKKGAFKLDAKVDRMLGNMGFADAEAEAAVSTFSGGWKMRIGLAKLLLNEPDVLLLDEPTNHMDIESVEWLENFLRAQAIPMVIVSHDREFLDQVADVVGVPVLLGRQVAALVIPRAAVLTGPAQHLHVAAMDSAGARPKVPRAAVGPQPLQDPQPPGLSSIAACLVTPVAALAPQPPDQLEVPATGSAVHHQLVHREAPLPAQPFHQLQVSVPGSGVSHGETTSPPGAPLRQRPLRQRHAPRQDHVRLHPGAQRAPDLELGLPPRLAHHREDE